MSTAVNYDDYDAEKVCMWLYDRAFKKKTKMDVTKEITEDYIGAMQQWKKGDAKESDKPWSINLIKKFWWTAHMQHKGMPKDQAIKKFWATVEKIEPGWEKIYEAK